MRKAPPAEALLDRILVPLDGSSASASILPRIVPLARAAASDVVVFRVVPFIETLFALPEGMSLEANRVQADTERAWTYVDTVARRLRQEGVDARGLAALGGPASTIVRAAEREGASLIAMSTHARSGLRRFAFGSVAGKVLRDGRHPLFLARPSRDLPSAAGPASWLYLADPAPESIDPLGDLLRLSRRLRVPMTLLHSRDETEILAAGRELGAELLILATSSEEGRKRAERLLRKLTVPLLVLPARPRA